MNVQTALTIAAKRLNPRRITRVVDRDLGRLEAEILLAHALNTDRAWLLAHGDFQLSTFASLCFKRLITLREKRMPIAYITGEKEFYALSFSVTRDVLIPRPETEMLVELATTPNPLLSNQKRGFTSPSPSDEKRGEREVVWDVGTGSGCVAIAIAKHLPHATILATDVSAKSLVVARRNTRRHHATRVTFLKANLLDVNVRRRLQTMRPISLTIVANLPYLPASDRSVLTPDVVQYEPSAALFAGKTGRELLEKFLRQLAAFDIHFARAFLECDPPQAERVRKFAKELFPQARIKIRKDAGKRDRVLEIVIPR
ncbi:MAG: peptide chain release factor N(5)-glutamine methyltransferase [Patescibacteria group bacterium]